MGAGVGPKVIEIGAPVLPPQGVKAGVYVKAVLTSLNTVFLPISRSCFKQR